MACGVCQGKPVEMLNMQTPGQQALDPYVAGAMKQGMGQGATPFGGQLSQGPVDPILQAIAKMYQMGGLGGYQGEQGGFPGGQLPPMAPSGINPSPFGGGPLDNGTGGGRNRTFEDGFDPTNPNDPRNAPPYNPQDPYNLRGRPLPQ